MRSSGVVIGVLALAIGWGIGASNAPSEGIFAQDREADQADSADGSDTSAPPVSAGKPSDALDFANYRSPVESFQYWLDTVASTNDEFIKIVADEFAERDVESPYDFQSMSEKERLSTIYQLRLERLDASFDFDLWFEKEGKSRTSEQKRQLREDKFRAWLSFETRERFSERHIRAVKPGILPDFDTGLTHIYLVMYDIVAKEDKRYRVDMSLYPAGLGWRWYGSELVEPEAEMDPATAKGIAAEDEVEELDAEIETINVRLDAVEDELAALQLEQKSLMDRRAEVLARKQEIERELDPYGTAERTLQTALKAMMDGKWEDFLAAHTADIRKANEKSEAAKRHFFEAAGGKDGKPSKVRSLARVRETIRDPDDESIVYLVVDITVSHRKRRVSRIVEEDSENGTEAPLRRGVESEIEEVSENKRVRLRFKEENGKWLIDEEIA